MHRYALVPLLMVAVTACPGEPKSAHDHDHDHAAPAPDGAPPTSQPAADPAVPAPASPNPGAGAQPLTHEAAFAKAKPIFEKYCESCHSKDGVSSSEEALDHFDMTTYPFGGHHAHEIAKTVRRSLGVGGKPTMPSGNPGAVKGEELELILAWADAFEKASAKDGEHHHDHGGHEH